MKEIIAKKIAVGCDHAGLELKKVIISELKEMGAEVINCGTDTIDSVDYPDYGRKVAETVLSGQAQMGVVICGTGIGISIAANRFNGIRCGLCHNEFTAKVTREHNNANILALGSRVVDEATALECVRIFFTTEFEGGRHQARVDKLDKP